ncbi:MAG TPA: thiamine phosphate synthase [Vicinamibacterales bacterium]|nr:thiamine phosphate synthase [Vicinamibacterales bacterium]
MTGVSRKPASSGAFRLPPLYPIIDVDLCRMRGLDPVAFAASCVRGGAQLVQVRQKGNAGGTAALLAVVRGVVGEGRAAGTRVIVNDRADVAAMSGADGVHVGQQDLPPSAARLVAGADSVIGISTHTREQIDEAAAGPADYIAVGPIFRTTTKETGYDPRGLDLLEYAARTGRPVVAIGGITSVNARDALNAGASAVAIIGDLLSEADPERRVREFLDIVTIGQ